MVYRDLGTKFLAEIQVEHKRKRFIRFHEKNSPKTLLVQFIVIVIAAQKTFFLKKLSFYRNELRLELGFSMLFKLSLFLNLPRRHQFTFVVFMLTLFTVKIRNAIAYLNQWHVRKISFEFIGVITNSIVSWISFNELCDARHEL